MVDDDVPQSADRIVEAASVLDPEALRHRDLHRGEVVAVPDGLEHRVVEAQVQDLVEAHLPEVVVDAIELRLVDVLVQLGGERAGGIEVVSERLLDDDPRRLRQPGPAQTLDDGREETGRCLEIEDRKLRLPDDLRQPLVRRRVAEVAGDVVEPSREATEDVLVDLLAGRLDRRARALAKLADGQIVDGDPDDRAVEEAAQVEPVERPERHHAGEVAGDPEGDEDVRGLSQRARPRRPRSSKSTAIASTITSRSSQVRTQRSGTRPATAACTASSPPAEKRRARAGRCRGASGRENRDHTAEDGDRRPATDSSSPTCLPPPNVANRSAAGRNTRTG